LFAGFWLGILKQLAQHMGPIVCILDLPLCRSNIGCMVVPCSLSPTTTTRTQTEESMKKDSVIFFFISIVKHNVTAALRTLLIYITPSFSLLLLVEKIM